MNQSEITKDLKSKESILSWLVKNDTRDIKRVGKIMNSYYLNSEEVIKAAENNMNPDQLLKKF
tara:strand:+ start:485 stop:673 length:189 start_codon:yes stop_codon:yes gene_type:complete